MFNIRLVTFPFVLLLRLFLALSLLLSFAPAAFAEIVKSPADDREYRSLLLDNGLKVMLVSDASADVAAAALDVNVGSGHDPKDREGLAHYLEHMLFLGTEKYPEASEYQQYISKHGGSHNAYTVLNHTNYFFSIAPDHLEGALYRFAQFFTVPLFNTENVSKERGIVHSEYEARKDDEGRRLWKARRLLYNPEHPSTQFSVGSLQTLADREGDNVRDDLIAFYQRYYHAARMALVVVSPDPLDLLESWAVKKFAQVRTQGEAYAPFSAPLILAKDLPAALFLKPLKDTRRLTFSFPIESMYAKLETKPSSYLSNLLGHEGEGSLLAELKRRAWANGLSAGLGYSDDVQASFDISISLSEQGSQQIEEIGRLLFASIALIRAKGVKQSYFDEAKALAALDFRFQEKSSESGLAQSLASMLHRFEAEDVLSKPYLFGEYNRLEIKQVLNRLRPDNVQVIISDPDFNADQKTDWYDVEYEKQALNAAWLKRWRAANATWKDPAELKGVIALPQSNPFIPNDVSLLLDAPNTAKPIKLEDTGKISVWHQSNVSFKQPKSEFYFSLRSNQANANPREAMLTELYVQAVKEAINAYAYPASLAGLSFRIYRHSRGLSVRISGYSDKQRHLLDEIIKVMRTLSVKEKQFARHYEVVQNSLENALKGGASDVVINGVYDVLLTSSWSSTEKLSALKDLTLADLQEHQQVLLAQSDLLVLSIGNVSVADSKRAGQSVARLLPEAAPEINVARARVRNLAPAHEAAVWRTRDLAAQHDDAALLWLFQGEESSIQERAYMQLLGTLIHPPFYQSLRTESGVGYIVSAFAFNLQDAPALGFSIQSNSHSVQDIVELSRTFMARFMQTLEAMPEAAFESNKLGLINKITQEDKQLSDVASRYWTELDRDNFNFNTQNEMASAIKAINKADLAVYYKQQVLSDDSAALLAYSLGKQGGRLSLEEGKNLKAIESLDDLRRNSAQYF